MNSLVVQCPNAHFNGTLLLFFAGIISSYNILASFIALVVVSSCIHIITLKHDRKRRPSEHFTAWLLGAMAGVLLLGYWLLPAVGVHPRIDLLLMLQTKHWDYRVSF